MKAIFGKRILQLDIDGVIVGDITRLLDRDDPLVMWRCVPDLKCKKGEFSDNPADGIGAYNTSMVLMDTGVMSNIWKDYISNPKKVELESKNAGFGTVLRKSYKGKVTRVVPLDAGDDDQAIVSLYAKPLNPPTWGEADGVYKVGRRGFSNRDQLPENARIVFFNGSLPNNRPSEQAWIQEHWR